MKILQLLVLMASLSSMQFVYAIDPRTNVVIIMSDDQRWDKITPEYMPNVYKHFVQNGIAFNNSFVPNPLCCPSRASTLTGNYSHSTGVWSNEEGEIYGGFRAFDDKHTIAVDFHQAGYRTAMIGKYLNGYAAGKNPYTPPGWDKWFAVNSSVYYDYAVTINNGKFLHYGNNPQDYIAHVLSAQATNFVKTPTATKPFFLYYAFTTPHTPATPDPRDLTRFEGQTDCPNHDNMLESAFSMDREIGKLFEVLPVNTLVVFMSDNGYLWGEVKGNRGSLYKKLWPYNESIRVPIYITSLAGSLLPKANLNDLVLNVDLRTTLTHAAGIAPITRTEGLDWFSPDYTARTAFALEHLVLANVPSYCGAREAEFMYVRYKEGDSYSEELYNSPSETVNLIGNPAYQEDYERLKNEAMSLCNPAPPGYSWL